MPRMEDDGAAYAPHSSSILHRSSLRGNTLAAACTPAGGLDAVAQVLQRLVDRHASRLRSIQETVQRDVLRVAVVIVPLTASARHAHGCMYLLLWTAHAWTARSRRSPSIAPALGPSPHSSVVAPTDRASSITSRPRPAAATARPPAPGQRGRLRRRCAPAWSAE